MDRARVSGILAIAGCMVLCCGLGLYIAIMVGSDANEEEKLRIQCNHPPGVGTTRWSVDIIRTSPTRFRLEGDVEGIVIVSGGIQERRRGSWAEPPEPWMIQYEVTVEPSSVVKGWYDIILRGYSSSRLGPVNTADGAWTLARSALLEAVRVEIASVVSG